MAIPRIQDARTADDHSLLVTFSNGQKKKYDVPPLLQTELFAPLKNPAFFKNVYVDEGGYAVSWNADKDINEYEIWKNGTTISE